MNLLIKDIKIANLLKIVLTKILKKRQKTKKYLHSPAEALSF